MPIPKSARNNPKNKKIFDSIEKSVKDENKKSKRYSEQEMYAVINAAYKNAISESVAGADVAVTNPPVGFKKFIKKRKSKLIA